MTSQDFKLLLGAALIVLVVICGFNIASDILATRAHQDATMLCLEAHLNHERCLPLLLGEDVP